MGLLDPIESDEEKPKWLKEKQQNLDNMYGYDDINEEDDKELTQQFFNYLKAKKVRDEQKLKGEMV